MTVITTATVQLTVLVPALAALGGLLLRGRRAAAGLAAVAAAALALLLAVVQVLLTTGRPPGLGPAVVPTVGPLPVGELAMPLNLLADRTSALIAVAVGIVGLAVQVFSVWYLRDDPRYAVFSATVSLFLAAMLLLVQSGDLVLTLVGWEVMGWCSYLLIGHVSAREAARRAATKAFLVTRVADIGFVVGVVVLAAGAGSTELSAVVTSWSGGSGSPSASLVSGGPALTAALVLLVVGVAGKSGLVPFQDWLPDAMEGPTPASALIHAATMVAAGTYVLARLEPLYAIDGTARAVLGVLAAATMVWSAVLAFAQSDVKRMLAYSTLSQVAVMLSALAVAGRGAGVGTGDGTGTGTGIGVGAAGGVALGHLVSHAIFKALLFLALGWLAVLAGGTTLVTLRGQARGRGALLWSLGIGLAALAGIPPLVGFFSKEGVLWVAEAAVSGTDAAVGWLVLLALLVTVALTAAYCMRAWVLLSTADPGGLAAAEQEEGQVETGEEAAPSGDELATGAHEARPVTAGAALTVTALAVATVLGVLFVVPVSGGLHVGVALALVSLVLVAAAALAVWSQARDGRDPAARLGTGFAARSDRGFGADSVYVGVGRAVTAVARLVVRLDRDVVDAYPRGAASLAGLAGRAGERTHRGTPSVGLVAVVAGVVLVAVAGVTAWR